MSGFLLYQCCLKEQIQICGAYIDNDEYLVQENKHDTMITQEKARMNSNQKIIKQRKILEQGKKNWALDTGGGATTQQPLTDNVIGAQ